MAQAWRSVRVFISSTFRDMHAERDHLVRMVFPELRERLRAHRFYLEEVDLRWGITKEQSENAETLALCLRTIDRCRPFFLGLLGERYGAVLEGTEREVLRTHGLEDLAGRSVTEIEIAYGALRPQRRQRALILLREPGAFDGMSASACKSIYVESGEEGRSRLAELKRCLAESSVTLIRYTARWDASVPDRVNGVQGRLVDLNVFGNAVRDALWQEFAVELGLGDGAELQSSADPLGAEREAHERLIASRARVFVGRKAQSEALAKYAGSEQDCPCIVIGAPGSGKSALLARLVLDLAADRPDVTVLAHFAGASPEAASLASMLTRLCRELYATVVGDVHRASIKAAEAEHVRRVAEARTIETGTESTPDAEQQRRFAHAHVFWRETVDAAFAIPTSLAELKTRFGEFIEVVPADRRLVLVIDGLDQLDAAHRAQGLDWLPVKLPAGVKIVASCVDDPDRGRSMLAAIRHRPHVAVEASPLSDHERRAIVHEIPSLSAKTLDPRQTELLLANPAASNPLFLTIALEELRGFGSFEGLIGRIRSLPGGHIGLGARLQRALRLARPPRESELIRALFDQILARLEGEHDRETIEAILTSLAVSRRGLAEYELAGIVTGLASGNDLFAILRQLRPYLIDRQGLLGLYHRELELAVRSRYLVNTRPARHALAPTRSKEEEARWRLAHYFEAQPWLQAEGDGSSRPVARYRLARKCEELAWQLAELGSAYRLLRDPAFLEATSACGRIAALADDINHALRRGREREHEARRRLRRAGFMGRLAEIAEPDDIETRRVRYLEEAIRRHQAFLDRHPDALLQCLWSTLWWRDCAELPSHCEPGTAPDLGRSPDLGLAAWLEQWRATRAQRTGDELWLRALRPPSQPVGTSDRTLYHGAELAVLAAVPLRRWLVSGGDNIVRIWHADTGEALQSLIIGDALSLRLGLLQPDLHRALAARTEESAQEGAPNSSETRLADTGTIRALACAPRGEHIAVGFGRKARLYDVTSGEVLHRFELAGEVTALAFSANGRLLAASDGTPTVRVWECSSGRQAHAIECDGEVQSVGFLGARLLAASRQMWSEAPSTVLWDLATGKPTTTIPRPEMALSIDGRRLMFAFSGGEVEGGASNVNVYEAKDGSFARQVSHPTALQVGRGPLALSANGDQIAFADAFDDGGQLHLVSVETGGDWPRRLGKPIRALVFPDVRDEETWRTMLLDKESDFIDDSARLSKDGTRPAWVGEPLVACGSADGTINIVATSRGGPPPRWARRHKQEIVDIQFSPDGRYLASASSDSVRIWHALDGIEHLCLEQGARAIAVSPDGQLIATASHDDQIRIWSVADGTLARSLACNAPTCLAYSADGATLLTGDDLGEVRLWPAAGTGTPRTLARTASMVHALACSPDGLMVAASCEDRQVRLIDARTSQEIGGFPVTPPQAAGALAFQAHRLAFTPEGGEIVSVDSQVGETHFWRRDGTYLGIINGSGDPVACGDSRYPWLALFHPLKAELSIRGARSREYVAHWPAERVTRIATHPSGVIFAAAEGSSVLLLRLESATCGWNPLSESP